MCFSPTPCQLTSQAQGQLAAQPSYVNKEEMQIETLKAALRLRRHNEMDHKKVDTERQCVSQWVRALSLMMFIILIACSQEAAWFLIWALLSIVIAARTSNALSGLCNQGQWPLTRRIPSLAHTLVIFSQSLCLSHAALVVYHFEPLLVQVLGSHQEQSKLGTFTSSLWWDFNNLLLQTWLVLLLWMGMDEFSCNSRSNNSVN